MYGPTVLKMTKIVSYLVWYLIYAASLLPLRVHYFVSDILSGLLGNIFSYRKSTIYTNIARCFPELSYNEINAIVKEYYKYMCDIMVESIWQVSASQKQLCGMVKTHGAELLDSLVARYGKVMVVMGHRGNWEMVGPFCGEKELRSEESFANYPITVTYKKARSRISNFLFEKMRMHEYEKFGNTGHIVGSKQVLRHVAKGTGKHTYLFIADQYPRLGGIPVRFLNQNTFFFEGAEFMARKLNLPVVYLDMAREKRGSYRITFSLIFENSKESGHGEITLAYARLLEKHIKENPYNWLWSHKRWKRGFTPQEEQQCKDLCG